MLFKKPLRSRFFNYKYLFSLHNEHHFDYRWKAIRVTMYYYTKIIGGGSLNKYNGDYLTWDFVP